MTRLHIIKIVNYFYEEIQKQLIITENNNCLNFEYNRKENIGNGKKC